MLLEILQESKFRWYTHIKNVRLSHSILRDNTWYVYGKIDNQRNIQKTAALSLTKQVCFASIQ